MGMPRSLVLITVDCLRAGHVGFMGYPRPTTPFLDSLASQSIVLSHAIVAGAPTYYSFPAIMASRHPLALGRDVLGLAPDETSIATALNQVGYDTAAFVAGNPYLTRRHGYAEGFNAFHDYLTGNEDNDHDPGARPHAGDTTRGWLNHLLKQACCKFGLRSLYDELYFRYGQRVAARSPKSLDQLRRFPSADVLVSHAGEWLGQLGGAPFFLWLHLMDPHGPYYPREDALALMGLQEMTATRARWLNSYWNRAGIAPERLQRYCQDVIALYDSGIRWVDQQMAVLVGTLKRLGLWDSCAFALTADHGEEFLDHGGRMHAPPKVTEELVHVPLMLYWTGTRPQRIDAPFSLLNLAPTLLDCLQVPVPADFRGRSYWSQLKAGQGWDGEAIVECIKGCNNPLRKTDRQGSRVLAVRDARYKLILNFDAGPDQLFDLQTDPEELSALPSDEAKEARRRLLERAHKHITESLRAREMGARAALLLREIALECSKA